MKTLPREDEELFEGFGTQLPGTRVGAAKLNFLKTLRRHSSDHKDLAVSFRSGNNNFLRAMWKKGYRASESRLDGGSIGTESDHSGGVAAQKIDFDVTPRVIVTRSRGTPMNIENVQPRTLEYKRYGKK